MMSFGSSFFFYTEVIMASIFIKDDIERRAKKGILYDFLAADGSENRDAADVIHPRFK